MTVEKKLNLDIYQNLKSSDAPDEFHHVAFKTMNYELMIEFYSKLFGCEPLYESKELTFLAFDQEHHRVAIANTFPVFKNLSFIPKQLMKLKNWLNKSFPSIVGLDHISYKLNPIDKWFEFYFSAKKKGLLPYWTINHGWITGMYYKDPDGNLVEIFFEHFHSAEEFKKNIAPDFSDEPVGTNMDVETLYELFKNGASFEELIQKGNTVPEGKKPVFGMEAVRNMRKKFK
tara:strand:+ start:1475 stop:2164 length:690 start_codon:yes stop_codon:yes gene_type:complete